MHTIFEILPCWALCMSIELLVVYFFIRIAK